MEGAKNPIQVNNLGLVERWMSIVAGGALVAHGMKNRSIGGLGSLVFGGGLVYRGIAGHCDVYEAFGVRPGVQGRTVAPSIPYQQGIRVDRSITINKGREELYRFWRNLENLPRFMCHVHSVVVLDEKRSHWIVKGSTGKTYEWDAEINNEIENELIGWRSLPGADVDSAGSVHFQPEPHGRGTTVTITLQYKPPGGVVGAAIAKLLGENPGYQVREELRHLKQLLETGEIATTSGQPSGREAARARRPIKRARRHVTNQPDDVEQASEASFPASDAPSWTAPKEELVS